MLLGFQSDLGSISSEILSLQRKSVAMSQQLHNRQAVHAPLGQFIDDMTVSEALIMWVLCATWTFIVWFGAEFANNWKLSRNLPKELVEITFNHTHRQYFRYRELNQSIFRVAISRATPTANYFDLLLVLLLIVYFKFTLYNL